MRLVLGGGGLACLTYIGTYETFISRGTMDEVTELYGVSGGSIMGLGMVLRIPPGDLLKIFRENYPFKKEELKITHLISKYGLDTGNGGRNLIEAILAYKNLPKDTRMSDLASFDIQFNVCVTNLSTYEKQLFTTRDDVSVVEAIMASSTIPILFVPVRIKDEYFIDGSALWHSFPIALLKEGDIGVCSMTRPCREEKMTFWNYVSRLMSIFSTYISFLEIHYRDPRVIYFEDVGIKMVSYEPFTDAEYERILDIGREYSKKFFEKQDKNVSDRVEKALSDGNDTTTSET